MRLSNQWEAKIGRQFRALVEKLLGPAESQTCLELYEELLAAIADKAEPVSGSRRIFPFNHLLIELPAGTPERRAMLEAAFGDRRELRKDVLRRLGEAGSEIPEALEIDLRFSQPNPANDPFAIHFLRAERSLPQIRITVERGASSRPTTLFRQADVRLGRCAEVVDTVGRLIQRNDVAFLDNGEPINSTVSRKHAHIEFDAAAARFILIDDFSERGTVIFRDNHAIQVPKGDSRGAVLQADDQIYLGRAVLRFEIVAG
jgi:hypothetical protein